MARIVKPQDKAHAKRVRCDQNNGEMLLVGRGVRAYLWVGRDTGAEHVTTYSGRKTLREFAQAILDATA